MIATRNQAGKDSIRGGKEYGKVLIDFELKDGKDLVGF